MVRDGIRPVVADRQTIPLFDGWAREGLIEFVPCDLSTLSSRPEPFTNIEQVVHLAAWMAGTDDVVQYGDIAIQQNLLALMRLVEALPTLRHLCFVSSIQVYADPPVSSPLDEDHPTAPPDLYGTTKLAGEQYLRLCGDSQGFGVAVLRLCGVYGPGAYSPLTRNRAIPKFIRLALAGEAPVVFGDGQERRDYVFVDDVVSAIRKVLALEPAGTFNIGSGVGTTILDLARAIIDLAGVDVQPEIKPGRGPATTGDYTLNITRAERELGFRPSVSLAAGLAMEIEWVKSQAAFGHVV